MKFRANQKLKSVLRIKAEYDSKVAELHNELKPYIPFEFFINDFAGDGLCIMKVVNEYHPYTSQSPTGMRIEEVIEIIDKRREFEVDDWNPSF